MSERARVRCAPTKVGLAAEVERLLRAHATPAPPADAAPEDTSEDTSTAGPAAVGPVEDPYALACTLAAIQSGDTPEHVARMKAIDPGWDETRGLTTLAQALLASPWFAEVQARAAR